MIPVDTSPSPEARMLQRAEWLQSLTQPQREELFDLPLREVDDRFAAWLGGAGVARSG